MSYSTEFIGTLKFDCDLHLKRDFGALYSILGEDAREHPEWGVKDVCDISLCITNDLDGLEWDGSEKAHNMVGIVNAVIKQMRKVNPEFRLSGALKAQGEDARDRYWIVIGQDGFAHKKISGDLSRDYTVLRKDGKDSPGAKYFVLRLDEGAENVGAARAAFDVYLKEIGKESPDVAKRLLAEYGE